VWELRRLRIEIVLKDERKKGQSKEKVCNRIFDIESIIMDKSEWIECEMISAIDTHTSPYVCTILELLAVVDMSFVQRVPEG